MEELRIILREQAARYPGMEPTDAVKLIYQNEFGGGHLIRDEQRFLDYLRREYESVQPDPAQMAEEHIGNGMVRVHLAALEPEELEPLGRAFIRSANAHRGSMERFREKLAVLRQMTEEGVFSFSLGELERYLAGYEAAGFPPVSHSERYREQYHPAYRIVEKKIE